MRSRAVQLLSSKVATQGSSGKVGFSLADYLVPQRIPLVASSGNLQVMIGYVDSFIATDEALFAKLNFYGDRESQQFSNAWDNEANPMKLAFQSTIYKQAIVSDRETSKKIGTIALDWKLDSVRLVNN